MAAGMKDVASLAGVAVGTVSNVLNHPDLVRPLTRARVEAAMEQLGFIPNGSARQLRAGRSRCLGLVVLDVTNPFFTEVARGVEDYAQAAGYAVILCNSDEADDKERRYLRVLEEQRVRGILITPVHGRAPELRRIRERGTPVVLLDRPGSAGQCSVAVDDRRGGEIAVTHLLGLGHRSIALVNGPTAIRQCADRRRGAYHAVERAGLDPAQVLSEVTVSAMNARGGASAGDELLGAGRRPTAVFCTNDMLALGLLRRLTQAGVAVPADLALVGYDDIEFAADAAVPLTSVRQPKYQLGRAAAELLLDEADRPDEHEHRRFVFKPELVARASSGSAVSQGAALPAAAPVRPLRQPVRVPRGQPAPVQHDVGQRSRDEQRDGQDGDGQHPGQLGPADDLRLLERRIHEPAGLVGPHQHRVARRQAVGHEYRARAQLPVRRRPPGLHVRRPSRPGRAPARRGLEQGGPDLVQGGPLRPRLARVRGVGPASGGVPGDREPGQEHGDQQAEHGSLQPVQPAPQRVTVRPPSAQQPAQPAALG